MAQDDAINRRIWELFDNHIRCDRTLDDIKALDAVLPDDPAVLRGLASRCLEEGLKALRAGHHTEGRRFDILGRQLQRRAERIDRGK